MSNILLNSTTTTQQQLLAQQQQQQLDSAAQSSHATSDQANGSAVAVPDDKDPDSYRLAYQAAINEGRTPDAAAKIAYKNAAPRVNSDAGAHGEGAKTSGDVRDRQAVQGSSSKDVDGGGKAIQAEGTGSGQKATGTERTKSGEPGVDARATGKDVVDTNTPRGRSLLAVPNSGADVATAGDNKPAQNGSLNQIADIATDPGSNHRQVQTSRMYSNMVDAGVSPAEAEVGATNTYTDLTPNARGHVDGGTAGTIAMGDTKQRLAANSAQQQAIVQKVTQQLVQNPELVSTLANSTDTKQIQDTLNKAILDGTLDAMSGTDENGNKKSSVTGGGSSSGKSGKKMSLNPMELVMVAMMEAAIEGQKQAQSLAEDVQANTDLKRSLRGVKSDLGAAIRQEGGVPGQASGTASSSSSGTTSGASVTSSTNVNDLQQLKASGDVNTNQNNYQKVSDALDNAGDDSSILMIKLQTASQIVTTFLQACSNVSKGVTDTTKAVIGNIGH